MILVGLLVSALFEEDEGRQQGGGIEERFFYERGIVVVSYDMSRLVFVYHNDVVNREWICRS